MSLSDLLDVVEGYIFLISSNVQFLNGYLRKMISPLVIILLVIEVL